MITQRDVDQLIQDLQSFKRQAQETHTITNDVEEVVILHGVITTIDQLLIALRPLVCAPPIAGDCPSARSPTNDPELHPDMAVDLQNGAISSVSS